MPPKKITLKEAPFSSNGSLLHWANRQAWTSFYEDSHTIWKPNEPFTETLRIDHTRSGRSAKYVIWRPLNLDDTRTFPMFVVDLVDAIQTAKNINSGVITGRWAVRKRGQNYGLVLLLG